MKLKENPGVIEGSHTQIVDAVPTVTGTNYTTLVGDLSPRILQRDLLGVVHIYFYPSLNFA
jgi:hypothetical protein